MIECFDYPLTSIRNRNRWSITKVDRRISSKTIEQESSFLIAREIFIIWLKWTQRPPFRSFCNSSPECIRARSLYRYWFGPLTHPPTQETESEETAEEKWSYTFEHKTMIEKNYGRATSACFQSDSNVCEILSTSFPERNKPISLFFSREVFV